MKVLPAKQEERDVERSKEVKYIAKEMVDVYTVELTERDIDIMMDMVSVLEDRRDVINNNVRSMVSQLKDQVRGLKMRKARQEGKGWKAGQINYWNETEGCFQSK